MTRFPRGLRRQFIIGSALLLTAACDNTSLQTQTSGENTMPTQPAAEEGEHKYTNRLAEETSPYLLQHAHNPVNWYPWGPEAFEAARREQKLIFLSIGYSTCYWCHVMERESFEDETTAKLMNEHFISIKVDREERPDVDDIYMAAVQWLTKSGGWPMSTFLLPPPPADLPADAQAWVGLTPFWGGTYFPAEPSFGRPGFKQILTEINRFWIEDKDKVFQQAAQVAAAVAQQLATQRQAAPVGSDEVAGAASRLLSIFDPAHGGFGQAPKFPQPVFLEFLMDVRDSAADESQRKRIDQALSITLDRMAMGGMYDQVGGGFHRYSTDAQWLVPHFEKMLYDNGQLAGLYAYAATSSGDSYYAEIAGEICDYVLREMTDPQGGFYSAQDAEVHSREGQNYLWTEKQVKNALEAAGESELTKVALEVYGLNQGTNFQDPHHPDEPRSNVVFLVEHPDRLSARLNIARAELDTRLRRINEILWTQRATRDQPGLDDKVLAGWNGLMIYGLAETGAALSRNDFLDAARKAWTFIDANMRDGPWGGEGSDENKGGLLRSWRAGRAKVAAFCEDYAYLAKGLIALHKATGDQTLLDDAVGLMRQARARFWDGDAGGYFDTLPDQSDLFVRSRSTYDGAVPSANGVMLHNLIELAELTGDDSYLDDALRLLAGISADLKANPLATVNATRGLHILMGKEPSRVAAIGTAVIMPSLTGPVTQSGGENPRPDPVRVSTSVLTVKLDPDNPAALDVILDIEPGYHVNANEPGDASLIGLHVSVAGGEGIAVHAQYPAGDRFTLGDQPINVHTDRVSIPLTIEQTGAITGNPQIVVTFQVCTNTECLAPIHHPLELKFEFD